MGGSTIARNDESVMGLDLTRRTRDLGPRRWMTSVALTLAIALTMGIVAVGSSQVASGASPTYGPQGELPFYGLALPYGVAVDSAGDVFVANTQSNQVLEITAGGTPGSLPFTGLDDPTGLALDSAGDVFVANTDGNQVLELTAGGTQRTLYFNGLESPSGVAVDSAGDVFVADSGAGQVLELTAGAPRRPCPSPGWQARGGWRSTRPATSSWPTAVPARYSS